MGHFGPYAIEGESHGAFVGDVSVRWDRVAVNLFAYVGNDPVNRIDPWGLQSLAGKPPDNLIGSGVFVCSAPTMHPILSFFGLHHFWIRTAEWDVGALGCRWDSVPAGVDPDTCVEVIDHSFRLDMYYSLEIPIICVEYPEVEAECVNEELENRLGDVLGEFSPSTNCITFVESVLNACWPDLGLLEFPPGLTDIYMGPVPLF